MLKVTSRNILLRKSAEFNSDVDKGAIVTIVDRKSMYLKLSIPCSKSSKIVANEIKRLLHPFKKKVHTITTDNGLEFAKHGTVQNSVSIG